MLVLTRKPGESVRIGEAVVTILNFKNGSVRVGIEAPKSIEVRRCEKELRLPQVRFTTGEILEPKVVS